MSETWGDESALWNSIETDRFKIEVVCYCAAELERHAQQDLPPREVRHGTYRDRTYANETASEIRQVAGGTVRDILRVLQGFPKPKESQINGDYLDRYTYRNRIEESALSLLGNIGKIEILYRSKFSIFDDYFATRAEKEFFDSEVPPTKILLPSDLKALQKRFHLTCCDARDERLARGNTPSGDHSRALVAMKMRLESIVYRRVIGNQIIREIEFAPEHRQAGIGILSYFAKIVEDKYPGLDVSVSIRQNGDLVTMIVEHPDGTHDEISKALQDYFLVVKGEKSVDDFIADPVQAMSLAIKLEQAKSEVRQMYMLLQSERDSRKSERASEAARIASLEANADRQNEMFTQVFGLLKESQSAEIKMRDALITRATAEGSQSAEVIKAAATLAQAIQSRDAARVQAMVEELRETKPDVFSRMTRYICDSAVSGAIGNAAYGWLTAIWPILPK